MSALAADLTPEQAHAAWACRSVPLWQLYRAAKVWAADVERHRQRGRADLVELAEYHRDHYLDLCALAVMLDGDAAPPGNPEGGRA